MHIYQHTTLNLIMSDKMCSSGPSQKRTRELWVVMVRAQVNTEEFEGGKLEEEVHITCLKRSFQKCRRRESIKIGTNFPSICRPVDRILSPTEFSSEAGCEFTTG